MRAAVLLLLTYAGFVFDTSVGPGFGWRILIPHLVPAVLVCCVWNLESRAGLALAALTGLVVDGLGSDRLGIGPIVFVVVAWGVQSIRARRPTLSTLGAAGLTGAAAFGIAILLAGARGLAGPASFDMMRGLKQAAGAAPGTALAVALLLFAVRSISRPGVRETSAPHVSNRWKMLTGQADT